MLNTYCIHLHTGSKRKQRRRHAIEFVATRLYVLSDIGFGIGFAARCQVFGIGSNTIFVGESVSSRV